MTPTHAAALSLAWALAASPSPARPADPRAPAPAPAPEAGPGLDLAGLSADQQPLLVAWAKTQPSHPSRGPHRR